MIYFEAHISTKECILLDKKGQQIPLYGVCELSNDDVRVTGLFTQLLEQYFFRSTHNNAADSRVTMKSIVIFLLKLEIYCKLSENSLDFRLKYC